MSALRRATLLHKLAANIQRARRTSAVRQGVASTGRISCPGAAWATGTGRSMLALQYAHTGRDGQRRERHHDRDDAGQYKTYALESHRIGHAALHWKVVFFG